MPYLLKTERQRRRRELDLARMRARFSPAPPPKPRPLAEVKADLEAVWETAQTHPLDCRCPVCDRLLDLADEIARRLKPQLRNLRASLGR